MARRSAVFVVCVAFACGVSWAGDGGFNGLPLGIDLSNTSEVDYGYVRIPDDDGLESQTFTVEAWIHPLGNGFGNTDLNAATVVGKQIEGGSGNALGSWYLKWCPPTAPDSEKIKVTVIHEFYESGTGILSVGTVPIGTSAHLAMTFDGTWLRVFINGEEDEASPKEANSSVVAYGNQDVLIGAANFALGYLYRFDGIIDEVRIWDHARTEGEIAGQMNCALDGTEPGLLAYYSFNMGDARDDSGQGHDGLIEGAADYVDFSQDCMIHFDGFDDGTEGAWN